MSEALQRQFQNYAAQALADRWPAPALSAWRRLTDGWESELYAFDLEHGPATARSCLGLVLRLYPGEGAGRKAAHEFTGMRRLRQAGYPVPVVHHLQALPEPLSMPFILMERIDGETMWPALQTSPPARQQALLRTFCHLMARLHALEWPPFAADPAALAAAGPYALADAFLTEARAFVGRMALPGFGPVVDWLAAHRNRAACERPAVTHGDFHPANVLVRPDGTAVVIDWPGLGVRDARTDLGWTLMLTQCFAGSVMRAAVLAGYEAARGAPVEHLDYFEVQACARRLADLTVSLTLGPERMGMRPAARALMQAQLPAMAAAAEMLQARTGLRIPEAEAVLQGG